MVAIACHGELGFTPDMALNGSKGVLDIFFVMPFAVICGSHTRTEMGYRSMTNLIRNLFLI